MWAAEQSAHPVVLMSCKQAFNKQLFLDEVATLSAQLKGKTPYKLIYPS